MDTVVHAYSLEDEREATMMMMICSVAYSLLAPAQRRFTEMRCLNDILPEIGLPDGYGPHSVEHYAGVVAPVGNDSVPRTFVGALVGRLRRYDGEERQDQYDIVVGHPGTAGSYMTRHFYEQLAGQISQAVQMPLSMPDGLPGTGLSYWVHAQQSLWPQVQEAIHALVQEEAWSGRILVAGYSLGGAMASITAARILVDERAWSGRPMKLTVYTFGSPRVGDKNFADFWNKQLSADDKDITFFRLVHKRDPIPHVPPPRDSDDDRVHHGIEVYYSEDSMSIGNEDSGKRPLVDRRRPLTATENPAMSSTVSLMRTRIVDHREYLGVDTGICNGTDP